MKKKIGTLIEEKIIRESRRRAAEEGRPLSALIRDALVSYLSDKVLDPRKREKAYQVFCEQPLRISKKQLKKIMETDSYRE